MHQAILRRVAEVVRRCVPAQREPEDLGGRDVTGAPRFVCVAAARRTRRRDMSKLSCCGA
jgi:hypothetical protein